MTRVDVHVLGIRHHGPGSARSVRRALDLLRPQVVLVEGPADCDDLLELVGHTDLQPPVALMAYAPDAPATVSFWPFALFSPEWQAISWARENDVPVRFCDLPASTTLALCEQEQARAAVLAEQDEPGDDVDDLPDDEPDLRDDARRDPVAALAAAAGHDDPERWWEDVVEHRLEDMAGTDDADGTDSATAGFDAVRDAMAAVRDELGDDRDPAVRAHEAAREAQMRQTVRAAARAHGRVAVVCGAWHAPALAPVTGSLPSVGADRAALRAPDGTLLPRRKVTATWVPWTHSRLSSASGYGAGVTSPGWYHHLFSSPDRVVTRWLTRTAALLREHDLPVSSAHVIEGVRLADSLAALRGRPLAGLAEVVEATRAVLCEGEEAPTRLVVDQLVVGEQLGTVPDDVPTVPLTADLRATARRLRLRPEPSERLLDLDLRTPRDTERSRLLHRLRLLEIPWGVEASDEVRSTGTFRETWRLRWDPELEVTLVERARWGATVAMAATARVLDAADDADLARLGGLVDACLVADLPETFAHVLARLDQRAAASTDVVGLMQALPPLVRTLRYGDVRGTDTGSLARVVDALLARVCAGLPAAVGSLDADAAGHVRTAVDAVHGAVALHDRPAAIDLWLRAVRSVADRRDVAPVLVGRAVRLLRDVGRLTPPECADRLSRALSAAVPTADRAAWVDGFLSGGGALLVHDRDLLALLDGWVVSLPPQDFVDVLPLVRRTFSGFTAPERRQVGEAVRALPAPRPGSGASPVDGVDDLDDDADPVDVVDVVRAAPAVATVARLLGAGR